MDALTWIHADTALQEIRQLDLIISADMQVDISPSAQMIDNTWSMTLPENVWAEEPIYKGHYVYAPGTEWGGPVTLVKHNTETRQITIQGPTWRGMLFQKIIYPPSGSAYLELTNVDANAAITQVAGDQLGALFQVNTASAGVNISAQFRYQSIADGLETEFRKAGMRLDVAFDQSEHAVMLSAVQVEDKSASVEISQDYGVNFASEIGNVQEANHCLALGQGQLTQRTVLHVYRVGNAYYTEQPSSLQDSDLRTVKLDYPNAEDEDELEKEAIKRLQETASRQSIKVDEIAMDMTFDLGDIIGVRDRVTGLVAKSEAQGKILTISQGRTAIALTIDSIMTGSSLELHYWSDLYSQLWDTVATSVWGDFPI